MKTFKDLKFEGKDIKALRKMAGKTQQESIELVHRHDSAHWRKWEGDTHVMPVALVELYCIKCGIPFPPKIPKNYYDKE